MQIPVNKNIDEYKDDFYKGLTMKQTVIAVLAILLGVAVFFILYAVIGLSQTVSLYLALPAVFPVGAAGFLKIRGLPPMTYLKRKRQVEEHPLYKFVPDSLLLEKPKEKETGKTEKVKYLETEAEAEKWL